MTGAIGTAVAGGHGELFVQQFEGETLEASGNAASVAPAQAADLISANLVVGSGARQLVEARGWGEARDQLASAASALGLPTALRTLAPRPVYIRAPDARVPEAA